MKKLLLIFLLSVLLGPICIALSGKIDFKADYRTANRSSAHLAPLTNTTPEAVIQVYAARAFNWRGIFAVHTWLAVKPKNAHSYTVYQVIGWRLYRGLPAVAIAPDVPDRYWFNHTPDIIFDLRGEKAEHLIPKITQAAAAYPYAHRYTLWPRPNSNTFIAYIARQIPELNLALPSNAVGKDYFVTNRFFARAASNTGYQFSLFGLFGLTLALHEGLEINLLGLIYGINPISMTLKWPGFGDIKLY